MTRVSFHMENDFIALFEQQKAFAFFEDLWRGCDYHECRKRRKCTGGPRGTCRQTKGVPLCKIKQKETETIG